MRNFLRNKASLSLIISTIVYAAYPAIAEAESVVTQWNDAALEAVRATKSSPTKTARALAITHTCMFDAWAAFDNKANGTQLEGRLRQPIVKRTEENKREAMSYAARNCLVDLFPLQPQVDSFNAVLEGLGFDSSNASIDYTTPAGVGNIAAAAVLAFRHKDGSNQSGEERQEGCDVHSSVPYSDYTCYQPVNTVTDLIDPSHWQPLVGQSFLTPQWGLVKPYALKSGDQLRETIALPANYETDRDLYELQAKEILDITATLSDKKKAIAEYWADGPKSETPPGHWTLFAKWVSDRDHHDLNDDVKMFFAMTNAMFDSSIVTWDAKRYFDYVRPICAIRFLYAGKEVESWNGIVDGAKWTPYQPRLALTPPFSEYVSGHSGFSASAAEILKRFTGSDAFDGQVIIVAGSSKVEPGIAPANSVKLRWKTFSAAADEAGISRRYGGIHFKQGDLESRKLGRLVGKIAWEKSQGYFNPGHETGDSD